MSTPPPHNGDLDAPAVQAAGRPGSRLDGWKAIAGHLGRDIRTAQRWEQSEGLPVHRLEHKQRASAYAFSAELDAWMARRTPDDHADAPAADAGGNGEPALVPQPPPAGRTRRWPLVAIAVGLAALVIAGLMASRTPAPGPRVGDTADPDAFAAFAEGRALYLARQYSDAAVALERAVTRDAQYAEAWAWLAKSYGRLAQPVWAGGPRASDRATEAARRAAGLAPDSPDAQIALTLAARAAGDIETWRAHAQRAIALDPRAAEALALLGDSYSAVVYACHPGQDPALAEDYYRRSMELMPNLTTTASNRAGNLRRMGRYKECVDLLNRFMRAYRDEPPLLAVRGACRLMLGDVTGATDDIAPLRNNPKMAAPGSLVYLGMLAMKTGNTADGIRDLEAFTQYDRSARTELIAAETYSLMGDVERAAAHLKRAFDLDPACPAMVDTALGFTSIRHTPQIERLLGDYGVR